MCCGCDLKSKWLNAMCVINMIFSEALSSAAIRRISMTANSTKHTLRSIFPHFMLYCGSCNSKFGCLPKLLSTCQSHGKEDEMYERFTQCNVRLIIVVRFFDLQLSCNLNENFIFLNHAIGKYKQN